MKKRAQSLTLFARCPYAKHVFDGLGMVIRLQHRDCEWHQLSVQKFSPPVNVPNRSGVSASRLPSHRVSRRTYKAEGAGARTDLLRSTASGKPSYPAEAIADLEVTAGGDFSAEAIAEFLGLRGPLHLVHGD